MAVDAKSIALDVRVQLESGEQVDVEMQSQRRPALRERALYYWARLYSGQLVRGDSYRELRRCVVVLITSFVELSSPRFHSVFHAAEQKSRRRLTDHLELHLVELPKLKSALDSDDEPSLRSWGKFLTAAADEDFEELAMENPVFKQAKDALERLSADPEARVRAEQREMALISYEIDLAKVRREGRVEGRAEGKVEGRAEGKVEGRAEGKVEILRRQLTLKFGELPPAARERLSRGSDAQLLAWSERLLFASTLDGVFDEATSSTER
jgi:predicted transposase/invertase (TIGR01784 family)